MDHDEWLRRLQREQGGPAVREWHGAYGVDLALARAALEEEIRDLPKEPPEVEGN